MRALLFSIALIIMSVLPALAVDVLIVQSGNGVAYGDAVRGFREAFRGSVQIILLSDYAEVDLVRMVKEEQPRLVLAVGDPALEKSKKVRQVPVVAVMALNPNVQRPPAPNIHAVAMVAPPYRYMELFASMGARRVGVLYDPSRSGHYVRRALEAADRAGIKLVTHQIRTPRETLDRIDQLRGMVDALWMLPDTTAVTSGTVEAYFTFSMKQQLPVVSFSERHLLRGAAASIDVDRVDMGRQAGELAVSILNNGAGYAGTAVDPRRLTVNTNKNILHKLELASPSKEW